MPVLLDGDLAIWDTLAIAEYLAETFPERQLWPAAREARARARSVCAEMHAGFAALREHFPMNIEASLPEVGERVLRERADVRADLDRIVAIWSARCSTRAAARCCSAPSRSPTPTSRRS